ncbi:MAG: hypothetical protein ACREGC_03495 [Minisyncoccia bacterium]
MNNIKEAINRGFNLLAVSVVGLTGFAFLPEVFVEQDRIDKLDDALLFILGIVAMIWYRKSNNRHVRSIIPVIFMIIGLVIKVTGLIIELDDPEAFGDDIGGVILFILGTALVIYQYNKTKKLLDQVQ